MNTAKELSKDFSKELFGVWNPRKSPDPRIAAIKEFTDFDNKIAGEKNNSAVIFSDLRKAEPPTFLNVSPSNQEWSIFLDTPHFPPFTEKYKHSFVFEWHRYNAKITFFSEYKDAQIAFLRRPIDDNTTTFLDIKKCNKELGTVCMETTSGLYFIYKNALFGIANNEKLSDGTYLDEAIAKWAFDQLKKAPKVAALPDNINKWEGLIIKEDNAKAQGNVKGKTSAVSEQEVRPGSVCGAGGYDWGAHCRGGREGNEGGAEN